MGKKKRKVPADQAAFDERTRMIEDYLARLSRRIEEKKATEAGRRRR